MLATIALLLTAVVEQEAPIDAPIDVVEQPKHVEASTPESVSVEDALALRGFAVIVELVDGTIVAGELRAVDDESLRIASASGDVVEVQLARVHALRKRDNARPPSDYARRLPPPDAAPSTPSLQNATAVAGAGGCLGCVAAVGVAIGEGVVLSNVGQGALAAVAIAASGVVVPAMSAAGAAYIATQNEPHGGAVAFAAGVGALAGMFVGGGGAYVLASTNSAGICAQILVCPPSINSFAGIFASAALGTGVGAAAFAASTHLIMYDEVDEVDEVDERSRVSQM